LASGRKVAVKLSHKDATLLPALHTLLCSLSPIWHSRARFVSEVPHETDGLIATGSDVTANLYRSRYPFLPTIVRGHRVSVAILSSHTTQAQIMALHRDLFLYFGLGCRSVVRLFIPEGFDLSRLTSVEPWPQEASHAGFRNAYRRQKALLTLQNSPFTDGGFFLLQPKDDWNPPVTTVYYTYYQNIDTLLSHIEENAFRIQCVVGKDAGIKNCITFGSAQNPQLWDYADGTDTMKL